MEEKINEVVEETTEETEGNYLIETDDDDCEEDCSSYKGLAILVGGLAVTGVISLGIAAKKGISKLMSKAAEKKAAKSEEEIDVTEETEKDKTEKSDDNK